MSLQGKVIEITSNCIIVVVEPKPECNNCHICTGLLDGEKRSKTREITVEHPNFEVKINDTVILDLNPGEGSIAAFLIFGIPIVGFFTGVFFTPIICELLSLPPTEAIRATIGFMGLAFAFFALYFISRIPLVKHLSLKAISKVN